MAQDLIIDLQRKNEKLTRKIKELEEKLSSSSTSTQPNSHDIKSFDQKIIELTSQLEDAQRELNKYKAHSLPTSSSDLINDLQVQVEKLKGANKRIKAESDQENVKLKEQLEQFKNLEASMQNVLQEKENIMKDRHQLDEELRKFNAEKNEVDSTISNIQKEVQTVQKQNQDQQENITSLQTALTEVQNDIAEKDQRIIRLENQIQAERKLFEQKILQAKQIEQEKSAEITKLNNSLLIRDQEAKKFKDTIVVHEQELMEARNKLTNFQSEIENTKKSHDSLQVANEILIKQLQEKDKTFELIKEQEKKSFQQQMNTAQNEIAALNQNIAKLMEEKTAENGNQTSEIDRLKKLIETLEHSKVDTDLLIAEIEDSQVKLNEEREKFNQMKQEWESSKKSLETASSLSIGSLLSQHKDVTPNIQKILEICFTTFWSGQPHFKILKILINQGEVSVENLGKATGIISAQVLKTCQELEKAKLIEFNIESRTAKIIHQK